ncbi:MAG: D-xylose transporter XylE [Salinivirgaceae bacterium]|jgi:SP family xylose:H+ symportor-like MFS transporter|nr:D-xylose transporter XylE [Salinivirgaceae bacterium]
MKHNKYFIYVVTIVATLGGLLFGYDTAVISGAEKSIQAYMINGLGLSSIMHGITVSSALVGCIIGGIISGILASKYGRRKTLIFAGILFLLSALGSANPEFLFFTKGKPTLALLWAFNFYRIVGGIGVGLASAVVPMYIGEIAPANIRGRLVSLNQFAIIFGMLVVYFVNWGIANGQTIEWINEFGWRRMFLSEAIPASLFAILMFFMPETPRYLALTNHNDKALSILTKINGVERAKSVLEDIKNSLSEGSKAKIFSYGKLVIIVGVLLSLFQQFVGINVALYYAPRIFESMGADKSASMMQTIIMGLVNVIFTVVAIMTVDKWGRKPLLITGSIGMAIGMIAISTLSFLNIIGTSTLVFIIIYTASFMMSWGPICWVLISEIFPNKIRSQAIAIAVAAQWTANFVVSSTFLPLQNFDEAFPFLLYGIISIISAIFVWKLVPETKGKTLEEMESIWKKK